MEQNIFIDANVLIDLFEKKRVFHDDSVYVMGKLFGDENVDLFISSDMISNIFYILNNHYKYGFEKTLDVIDKISKAHVVHPVSFDDISMSIKICKEAQFRDYEDALQYICALKEECTLIVTNNPKDFKNSLIEIKTTKELSRLLRDKI